MSDASDKPIGFIAIPYELSDAVPVLKAVPNSLLVGSYKGEQAQRAIRIENRGFAPLLDSEFVITKGGSDDLAPNWISVSSGKRIERLDVGQSHTVDILIRPGNDEPDGYYDFSLKLKSSGEEPFQVPLTVAVTKSGKGSAVVRAIDIYTGTIDALGRKIPGLKGATVKLVHDTISEYIFEGVTDDLGEVYFNDLPLGNYSVRASAKGHNDTNDRLVIEPGITKPLDILVLNTLVTIEWSVREIPLQDRYELVLDATYLTDIPIGTIVLEPASISLPNLRRGESVQGELKLTNYGFAEVTDLKALLPRSDGVLQFEFMVSIPSEIGPKERIVIPYRVTALDDVIPSLSGNATGGGCTAHQGEYCTQGLTACAAGILIPLKTCSVFSTPMSGGGCQAGGPGKPGGGIAPVYGGGGAGGSGGSVRPADPTQEIGCAPFVSCEPVNGVE